MTDLSKEYDELVDKHLLSISSELRDYLKQIMGGVPRIDRIDVRIKDRDRFLKKALKIEGGTLKYNNPIKDIQDVIGARIVTFYKQDVENIGNHVKKYFRHIEETEKSPEDVYSFGYFGTHFVLLLPSDIAVEDEEMAVPQLFELQIKTLFQHAWAEAGHDLDYKEEHGELEMDDRRKIAFASAQAWGADNAFGDVAAKRVKFN